jgi:hypothetical protein
MAAVDSTPALPTAQLLEKTQFFLHSRNSEMFIGASQKIVTPKLFQKCH